MLLNFQFCLFIIFSILAFNINARSPVPLKPMETVDMLNCENDKCTPSSKEGWRS